MKKCYSLLITCFVIFNYAYAQTTIYNEDFSGQLNKGASYNNTTGTTDIDLSGVNWTIDVSSTTFDNGDRFKVVNGNRFLEARDLDGQAIWYSPSINISSFTDIQFSLDATESSPAGDNLEDADTFITEFRIDGGAWTQAGNNGFIQNDYTNTVVSHNTLLNGNTLELRVLITNDGNGERMRIDNVLVQGIAPITPTITINPNTNTIPALSVVENNVSLTEETFSVQGSSLTNDIIITAPAEFVISENANGPYLNTITLTQTGGTINPTTIYTKLAFGLTPNTYSNTITVSSTGATNELVSGSGTVIAHTPAANCGELLISEYHEAAAGTANEQYIELYNPTNTAIDLSNYQIARFINGRVNYNPAIRTIPAAQGFIAPYSTFLIARNNSELCNNGIADYCTGSGALNFDGNDVIALQNSNGVNIDVVGVLNVNNNFGQNVNLVRNSNVQTPTPTYNITDWSSNPSNSITLLGSHVSDCECSTTVTWDGTSWTPFAPDSSTAVILTGDYNASMLTPGFTACSLSVNTGVTLTVENDYTVEVKNNVTNSGTIIVQTNGSFVQNNDSAIFQNTGGTSSVSKLSAFASDWLEYTYWSSPVSGETIGNALSPSSPNRRFGFNAENFEDNYAETNNNNPVIDMQDDEDDNGNVWQLMNAADTMIPGTGYAATLSTTAFSPPPGGGPAPPVRINHEFIGELNNGVIPVTIYRNDNINTITSVSGDKNWNLIGNPYASAISIPEFFAENMYSSSNTTGTIDGVIYYWSHENPPLNSNNGNSQNNFSQSDYVMVNELGGTIAGDHNGDGVIDANDTPDEFIPSGQGFFVTYNDLAPGTASATTSLDSGAIIMENEVTFRNAMRVSGNNDLFYRNANQPIETNKLWLNLTTDTGVFSQLLVGYKQGATNALDGANFDAIRNRSTGNQTFFYSIIENSNLNYAIQGKAPESLTIDEVIPLGIYTSITNPATFTISISHFEGDFLNNNTIYLKDNYTSVIHDLSASNYNFTTTNGEFRDRFEVVFNANSLAVEAFSTNETNLTIVELQDDNVQFSLSGNSNLKIEAVRIID
ncbi:MAG: hypothetical protein BM549_13910, partial [Lacinutrix sp. MedPE-SW]